MRILMISDLHYSKETFHGFEVLYSWNFGDGNLSQGLTVGHVYSQEGRLAYFRKRK